MKWYLILVFSSINWSAQATSTALTDSLIRYAPYSEYLKKVAREFTTTANGTTAIYNKHGNVNINTWAEHKVKIEVSIVVNAYNQKDADKMLNLINVNFANANGYVKAETIIGETNGIFKPNCIDYKINYEVWMPADNQLDIGNKYGNTSLAKLNGKLNADIRYGEFRIGDLKSDANCRLSYCTAIIQSAQVISGVVEHGSLHLDHAKSVQMETEYAYCVFRNADEIRITSKFDQIDIGVVNNLRLQAKYSSVTAANLRSAFITAVHSSTLIESLNYNLDADLEFGGLTVGKVFPGFDNITISGKNSAVVLNIEASSYCYDISGDNTGFKVPKSTLRPQTVNAVLGRKGCVGDGNTKSKITARLNNGSLVLE